MVAGEDPNDTRLFQYSPLNENHNEIRILTLLPGDFAADIHVLLETKQLRHDKPPFYEALSYVWGSTEDPVTIKVRKHGVRTLTVTQNLATALRHLRSDRKSRKLWADAICINQRDLKERSCQVKMMGDVYRLANRVVAWLGPELHQSTLGLRALDKLASHVDVDWVTSSVSWTSEAADMWWDKETRAACWEILDREWFDRLWVWQEIILANSRAILACGRESIQWQAFRKAIFSLCHPFTSSRIDSGREDRMAHIRQMIGVLQYDLYAPIKSTSYAKCLDPKDRIYALLSMSVLNSQDRGLVIEPDYLNSTSQVYQDVVVAYIKHRCRLNVLASCELSDERPTNMPSWVPNWCNPASLTRPLLMGKAASSSDAVWKYHGEGVLSVAGSRCAIVETAQKSENCEFKCEIGREIRRLAPHNVESAPYVLGGSLLEAYCSTLCVGRFKHITRPPRIDWPTLEACTEFLQAILKDREYTTRFKTATGQDADAYLEYVGLICVQRSFVTTEEGYIGIAPQLTKPGDIVVALLGCDRLLILRPVERMQHGDEKHRIVGECYIHGMQNGEAFLGPFPKDYSVVSIRQERSGEWYKAFLDKETGETRYVDPRLEPGTEMEECKEEGGVFFYFPDDSAVVGLTPESLRKRGVEIQNFELI
ncbi:hypothetical protein P7C71_g4496, partial [Lecanoromycetidae sp. Uapishka_2]